MHGCCAISRRSESIRRAMMTIIRPAVHPSVRASSCCRRSRRRRRRCCTCREMTLETRRRLRLPFPAGRGEGERWTVWRHDDGLLPTSRWRSYDRCTTPRIILATDYQVISLGDVTGPRHIRPDVRDSAATSRRQRQKERDDGDDISPEGSVAPTESHLRRRLESVDCL